MRPRLSLSSRLALLFAGCTAVVSLFAGVLFGRASEVLVEAVNEIHLSQDPTAHDARHGCCEGCAI